MIEEVKKLADQISKANTGITIVIEDKYPEVHFRVGRFDMLLSWEQRAINTLHNAVLHLILREPQAYFPTPKYQRLEELKFQFGINESHEFGWLKMEKDKRFYRSHALAEHIVNRLLDQIDIMKH